MKKGVTFRTATPNNSLLWDITLDIGAEGIIAAICQRKAPIPGKRQVCSIYASNDIRGINRYWYFLHAIFLSFNVSRNHIFSLNCQVILARSKGTFPLCSVDYKYLLKCCKYFKKYPAKHISTCHCTMLCPGKTSLILSKHRLLAGAQTKIYSQQIDVTWIEKDDGRK